MATGITKVSDLNSLYNTIFEDAIFVARESNIMTGLVSTFTGKGMMTRTFTTRPQISATVKEEGEDFVTPTKFGKASVGTLTPATVFAQSLLTDEDLDTDPENAKAQCATELGNAISTKIDRDLCADFSSLATDKGPGASGTATIAKFATAIAVLRNALCPNPIQIVLHPYCWFDIWSELGQPAATKALLGDLASQALKDFYVGDWLLAAWYVSANIVPSGTDAVSGVFNPQSLAFDSRQPPESEPERDASRKATELNISAIYAHGLGRRPTWGVKYTSDVTEPS